MANLKRSDISLIGNFVAWPEGFGYVLKFSNRTFAEFFEDEFRIDIEDDRYFDSGDSKRNRLISFCLQEPEVIVVKVFVRFSMNAKAWVTVLRRNLMMD